MPKIRQLGVHLNLSQIASEFGVARETARKRLDDAGVGPSETKGGHPVYRLRHVLEAFAGEEGFDPDKLKPWERKAHYQAEHEKLRLQVERGEVVPGLEVEQGQAAIFKIVTQFYETLPDLLERDVGASPLMLVRVEKALDESREALYQKLNEGDEPDADSAVSDRA
jgi:uncharacterized protein DUF1441